MRSKYTFNIVFLAHILVLSGCYTGEPVKQRSYITQSGKVQEASWQTDSGTWTVSHVRPFDSPEDVPLSPDPPMQLEYETPVENTSASVAAEPATQTQTENSSAEVRKEPEIQAPQILGDWTLDLDATMSANAMFSDSILKSLKTGLEYNPFDLSITNGMYISEGKGTGEVIKDKYEVISVDGDTVTIELTPAEPKRNQPVESSTVILSISEGNLLITMQGGLSIAMKRPEKDLAIIETRHQEILAIQDEIRRLHENLMIVGEQDEKYGAKLKEAWSMPPSETVLENLPASMPELEVIKTQLETKHKRYQSLIATGNPGI